MRTPLKDAARGRWRAILPALGIPMGFLSGKHQACPLCGGKDRARFDDKDGRGTYFCGQCGAGDGIELVKRFCGVDFKGAAELIEPLIGSAAVHAPPKPAACDETKRRWMTDLWNGAHPVTAEDPAGMWLAKRTGISQYPPALRFHDAVVAVDEQDDRVIMPAMLAKVCDTDGRPINVHRTYLTYRGDKAPIARARAFMPGSLPEGSSVRLYAAGEVLGIAEGIETAIAASLLHEVPCWAALNAGLLSRWTPPPGVRRVLVFADNDRNFAGQNAAYQLANRLAVKGKLDVEVRAPEREGFDWNDVLLRDFALRPKKMEMTA